MCKISGQRGRKGCVRRDLRRRGVLLYCTIRVRVLPVYCITLFVRGDVPCRNWVSLSRVYSHLLTDDSHHPSKLVGPVMRSLVWSL